MDGPNPSTSQVTVHQPQAGALTDVALCILVVTGFLLPFEQNRIQWSFLSAFSDHIAPIQKHLHLFIETRTAQFIIQC